MKPNISDTAQAILTVFFSIITEEKETFDKIWEPLNTIKELQELNSAEQFFICIYINTCRLILVFYDQLDESDYKDIIHHRISTILQKATRLGIIEGN